MTDDKEIVFKTNTLIDIDVIIELYRNSDYLPIIDMGNKDRLIRMHQNANLIVTAWHNEKLVGIARSLTDYSYCCYLSDIAVRNDYKGRGIGKKMIELTKQTAGSECKLILHSSNNAMGFYKKIGMESINTAFIFKREY